MLEGLIWFERLAADNITSVMCAWGVFSICFLIAIATSGDLKRYLAVKLATGANGQVFRRQQRAQARVERKAKYKTDKAHYARLLGYVAPTPGKKSLALTEPSFHLETAEFMEGR
jgi:hypothetical protein